MENRNHGAAGYTGMERRRPVLTAAAHPKPAVAIPSAQAPAGRHAAIRNTLPTLATYKSWSAKARTDWQEQPEQETDRKPTVSRRR